MWDLAVAVVQNIIWGIGYTEPSSSFYYLFTSFLYFLNFLLCLLHVFLRCLKSCFEIRKTYKERSTFGVYVETISQIFCFPAQSHPHLEVIMLIKLRGWNTVHKNPFPGRHWHLWLVLDGDCQIAKSVWLLFFLLPLSSVTPLASPTFIHVVLKVPFLSQA